MKTSVSLIFYVATIFRFVNGQICEPCEENKPCTVSFTFQDIPSSVNQIVWTKNEIDTTVCYLNNGVNCHPYHDADDVLSSMIEKKNGVTTNITFIPNRKLTSKISLKLYFLDENKDQQHLYTCELKMYGESLPVCNVCEGTKPCEFSYKFPINMQTQVQLIWKKDGTQVSNCYTNNECLSYPQYTESVISTIVRASESATAGVLLRPDNKIHGQNVTDSKWDLLAYYADRSSTQLYSCVLKVYNKLAEATCKFITAGVFKIVCLASKSYRESRCNFDLRMDENEHVAISPTMYNHTVIGESPVYYTTECSTTIPLENIRTGFYTYEVIIYPTTSTMNNHYDSTIKLSNTLTIERPRLILSDCPEEVDEGKISSCVCFREDKSEIETNVFWYGNKNSDGGKDNSSVLIFVAKNSTLEFICVAVNSLGWISNITYNPRVKASNSSFVYANDQRQTTESHTETKEYSQNNTVTIMMLSLILALLILNFGTSAFCFVHQRKYIRKLIGSDLTFSVRLNKEKLLSAS